MTYLTINLKQIPWSWMFGIIALMFNPFVPLRIDRMTWTYVDAVVGVLMLISIFVVREERSKNELEGGTKY